MFRHLKVTMVVTGYLFRPAAQPQQAVAEGLMPQEQPLPLVKAEMVAQALHPLFLAAA
jgi:hypothetical protein